MGQPSTQLTLSSDLYQSDPCFSLGPIEQMDILVSAQISHYLRFLVLALCPIRSKLIGKCMLLQITSIVNYTSFSGNMQII